MEEHQARVWLSEPRYQRFLDAAGGEHERAMALYEWHTELTIASFGLIHGFEVLLRNAIDAILGAAQPQTPIKDTWLLDFEILQPDEIKQVIIAIERLEKGKLVTRGRIVAGVSRAFWVGCSAVATRSYGDTAYASSHTKLSRARISAPGCGLVQRFGNRVAHHDSLLDQEPHARLEDMLTVLAGSTRPRRPSSPTVRRLCYRTANALGGGRSHAPDNLGAAGSSRYRSWYQAAL